MTGSSSTSRAIARPILLLALFIGALAPGLQSATKKAPVVAAKGMVATASALASQVGVEVLKAGGNAVDAAVAAAFAIDVVEPNATGIGGEGMMVIYLAKPRKLTAIDYRSVAPARAVFESAIPASGHAAVAVPGSVAGLTLALEKYGSLRLATVLAPAVKLAAEGFTVDATLGATIAANLKAITAREPLATIFAPAGSPLSQGATLRNPDLAASLRKIAAGGRDAFYRGELAERIAAEMEEGGGFITKEDLAEYQAIEREPVQGTYRGTAVVSAPPPGGGLSLIEILNILESFNVAKSPAQSATRLHLTAEAIRRGLADMRQYVGDPGFVAVPAETLLSKPYAKSRAAEIKANEVSASIGPGELGKEPVSTTHLSVVDKDGNMVSLTQTISDSFGSKVVVAGTGIILNNEMKNFSREGPNALAPRKRMRTTIAPTILLRDGKAFAALGTPGGSHILPTMTLLVQNLLDYRMAVQDAIEAPRIFPEEKALTFEPRWPEETLSALRQIGYLLKPALEYDYAFGGAQAIVIDPRTSQRIGGADPRRGGAVAGY